MFAKTDTPLQQENEGSTVGTILTKSHAKNDDEKLAQLSVPIILTSTMHHRVNIM